MKSSRLVFTSSLPGVIQIMGVGATKRFSAVRWGLAGKIITAWVFTLPLCFAAGWVVAELLLHM